jgi:cytochrome c oxidase assembly factor CtaG
MPPKLTPGIAFTQWVLDPVMMGLVVLLLGAYIAGVRRAGSWSAGRVWAFGFGLFMLGYATMSWVGVYQPYLFYARAVQTVLLVLVVPLFLAMGRPITLAISAWPSLERPVAGAIHSKAARVLTFPAITTFVLVAIPMVMYFTSWYGAVFHSGTVREFTFLVLMVPGFVFFWTLLRVDPVPKAYSYGVSLWITTAEVIGDAFFGIAIIADTNLLAGPYYRGLAAPFNTDLTTMQVIGGGVIWILGDLVGLPFLVAQLVQFMREDRAEAAAIDAELDAREQTPDAADPETPWWQSDPRFTDRFR